MYARIRQLGRSLIAVLVLAVFAAIFGGCSNPSGHGNEFMCYGIITKVGDRSVTAEVVRVTTANGRAAKQIVVGKKVQFHDNYMGGWSMKTVGQAYNNDGSLIRHQLLAKGDRVVISGKIRSSMKDKTYSWRAVYDRLQITYA